MAIIPRTKNDDLRARGDGDAAGETLTVNTHWFIPAVRSVGITNFYWRDCRHTYASRLRQTGTPLGNIAELLGHKGLAMTKRYAHRVLAIYTKPFPEFRMAPQ